MSILKPEDKHQNIRASVLAPKEPYHIPGYVGHKHQYKYQCGDTFGVTTNRLLMSAGPHRAVGDLMRPIDPPRAHTVALGYHEVPKLADDNYDVKSLLNGRRENFGDQLYKPDMRSGYMGFVPKSHFSSYHAKTFPNICNDALKDFSIDQRSHQGRRRALADTMKMQYAREMLSGERNMLGTKHKLPLRAVRNSLPPYMSESAIERHDSPYFLPTSHPEKYFKSGYAGHVPFYKDLAGNSYPVVTNQALKMFTDDLTRTKEQKDKTLSHDVINKRRTPRPPLMTSKPKVYLVDSGIIPRYGGYVPGQKFRFGHTFTNLTVNPLKLKESSAIKMMS
uniref:protein FAM166B-like n=1 Tax=Styela clava TaxID=7725 RepID=UPI00193A5EA2|nr:protein FAM166B-like [Styela clava]